MSSPFLVRGVLRQLDLATGTATAALCSDSEHIQPGQRRGQLEKFSNWNATTADEEPQRIGDILAELFARYENRFPVANIAIVQTPAVTEDQSCLFYPAELASVSQLTPRLP